MVSVGFPQKSAFGALTATSIVCPSIDSGVGDLVLKVAGVPRATHAAGVTSFNNSVLLKTDWELQDNSGGCLIAGDNSGNVDQLARIDAPVTSPTASHSVYVTAGEVVSVKENAKIDESIGSWLVVASDTFYAWLGIVLGRLSLLGTVYIESIKIFLATGHNDDYIDDWTLHRRPLINATRVQVVTSTDDIGNGTTGYVNGTLTVNHEVLADSVYSLEVTCNADNVNLKIYGLEIKYHLV